MRFDSENSYVVTVEGPNFKYSSREEIGDGGTGDSEYAMAYAMANAIKAASSNHLPWAVLAAALVVQDIVWHEDRPEDMDKRLLGVTEEFIIQCLRSRKETEERCCHANPV